MFRATLMLAIGYFVVAGCGSSGSKAPADQGVPDMIASSNGACSNYCQLLMQDCSDETGLDGGVNYTQYADYAACVKYCAQNGAWPAGSSGTVSGDTLTCRAAHAMLALTDPAGQCDSAGPTGNNVCGTWCENFCQLMEKNCTGANAIYDATTCMQKCSTMPSDGLPGDTVGDTVQCRIYHMGVAFDDPITHCPHGRTQQDNPQGPCT